MAALMLINDANLPKVAVHGTTSQAARSIAIDGMIPGGETGQRQANHFACTLANDVSTVVSGYRSTSQVCIFLNLPRWIANGHKAYLSPNEVICIFEKIHPNYFLAAVNVTNGYDYLRKDTADQEFLTMLRFKRVKEGPAVAAPRERTSDLRPTPGVAKIPSVVLDLTNEPAVIEAFAEEDPTKGRANIRAVFCGH